MRANFLEKSVLTALVASFAFAQNLQLAPAQTIEHSLPAVNQFGRTTISGREVYADVVYPNPNGRKGRADIVVVFDPLSSFYTWHFQPINKDEVRPPRFGNNMKEGVVHYVESDRMVVFWNTGGELFVRESRKRTDSLRSAFEASLKEIQNSLGELDKGTGGQHDQRFVSVSYGPLGWDFLNPGYTANPPRVKLIGVAKVDDKWEITVEVKSQAKLVLDKDYKVVAVKK